MRQKRIVNNTAMRKQAKDLEPYTCRRENDFHLSQIQSETQGINSFGGKQTRFKAYGWRETW